MQEINDKSTEKSHKSLFTESERYQAEEAFTNYFFNKVGPS